MRITVRIDDELHRELKKRAKKEGASLTAVVNQAIRRGLEADSKKKPKFKQ
jgi:predicted HicB family RNase H-like nuclease